MSLDHITWHHIAPITTWFSCRHGAAAKRQRWTRLYASLCFSYKTLVHQRITQCDSKDNAFVHQTQRIEKSMGINKINSLRASPDARVSGSNDRCHSPVGNSLSESSSYHTVSKEQLITEEQRLRSYMAVAGESTHFVFDAVYSALRCGTGPLAAERANERLVG